MKDDWESISSAVGRQMMMLLLLLLLMVTMIHVLNTFIVDSDFDERRYEDSIAII